MTNTLNQLNTVFGRYILTLLWLSLEMLTYGQPNTPQAATSVRSFNQLYALSPEAAGRGIPVRIQGTVLCYDFGWNQLYIHDGKECAWLSPQRFPTNLQNGLEVELTGSTTVAGTSPIFTNLQLQVLGRKPLPEARKLTIREMAADFGQWVAISGRVRVAETSSGRVALILEDNSHTALVYVMGPIWDSYESLRGCEVEVRGINASKRTGDRLEAAALTAPDAEAIRVLQKPDSTDTKMPLSSVENLLARPLGGWTNEPVRLSGSVVSYKPGEFLIFKDVTGRLRARVAQTTLAAEGSRVDVWGYFSSGAEPVLQNAWFVVQAHDSLRSGRNTVAQSRSTAGTELTLASQISRMSREDAGRGLPVRLNGIVTYADPEWRIGFVQDSSGGIFVDVSQKEVRAGHAVEVVGSTSAGGFAPEVVNATARILGSTNLPGPIQANLQDLASGHLDAHWVELAGVVRRASEQWGRVTLQVTTLKGRFQSIVLKKENETVPDLIGALVQIRGAVTSEINSRGQLTGIILYSPGFDCISVTEAVPADPFSIPGEPTRSVATFDPSRLAGRRVKVTGIVTMLLPAEAFYIQDDTGGLRINTAPQSLRMGDKVEVLGFPEMGAFAPSLEEAIVRRIESSTLPSATPTSAEEILRHGTNDATRVRLQAQLVQTVSASARPKLLLQSGSVIFPATVMQEEGQSLSKLQIGSVLEVSGVCVIQAGEEHQAESFRLLVRSSEDVRVLNTPPWWTVQNSLMVVGTVAFCAVLVWVWSASLRRQVRAQTEVIRRNEQELISVSRQAGMAEVATSVLHNVGNVLNSVNVSVQVATGALRNSKITSVARVADLLKEHAAELGAFVTEHPKGRCVPDYLAKLGEHLQQEQSAVLEEMKSLAANIQHISDIVAMQQNYAKAGGVKEKLKAAEIIEDALQMNQSALLRHEIKIERRYDPRKTPEISIERHKTLQILLNLVSNAKHACSESGRTEKRLTVDVQEDGENVRITCADNGIGIAPENLTRIFSHGFTTRRSGHGFGLHASALAAREMGGRLVVQSDGVGCGAAFTLELPRLTEKS